MTRRKIDEQEKLVHKTTVRLNDVDQNEMEKLRQQTNCQSMAEFFRLIILKKEITWYHKEATYDQLASELSGIRKELASITASIAQSVRYINGAAPAQKKAFESLHILDDFKKVGRKVDLLLPLIANLADKWLPASPPEKM